MDDLNTSKVNPLDEAWPAEGLELVFDCPFCGSKERSLAYEGVQDWSFRCAAGKWTYWDCGKCRALYLNPRPTARAISSAYTSYYTHGSAPGRHVLKAVKQRVRNEHWSQAFGADLQPRLRAAAWMSGFFEALKPWIAEPFELPQLAALPKGFMIDVGCGNGTTLQLAEQLGWRTLGIELDSAAVKEAESQGLNVVQGGYEKLASYAGRADCVICSHLLEHVHEPLRLLALLLETLKPEGVLLLSVPNASSHLRAHYGPDWRGLEAPRHLAIPDATWLTERLQREGWVCRQHPSYNLSVAAQSEKIKRRGKQVTPTDNRAAKKALAALKKPAFAEEDILQIVCTRASR